MIYPLGSIRHTAVGGAIGAGVGAGVVALLFADFGVGDGATASGDLLPWLAAIVLVVVAQFALAGGLCAFALQQLAAPQMRPAPRRAPLLATRRLMVR